MRKFLLSFSILMGLTAMVVAPVLAADDDDKDDDGKVSPAEKREKIDAVSKEALDTVFAKDPNSKKLFEKAYGYAVFDNLKLSLLLSTARGAGEAVKKSDGSKTYMKMGSVGLNIGLGGQKCQIIFFFETKDVFDKFVEKGWQAESGANAVAGTAGANAGVTFKNGMAVYQITEKGLMLQADINGTKYYKDKKLNAPDK